MKAKLSIWHVLFVPVVIICIGFFAGMFGVDAKLSLRLYDFAVALFFSELVFIGFMEVI